MEKSPTKPPPMTPPELYVATAAFISEFSPCYCAFFEARARAVMRSDGVADNLGVTLAHGVKLSVEGKRQASNSRSPGTKCAQGEGEHCGRQTESITESAEGRNNLGSWAKRLAEFTPTMKPKSKNRSRAGLAVRVPSGNSSPNNRKYLKVSGIV